MKQTAVEWLENEIAGLDTGMSYHYFEDKIKQAKEMEKEQIEDAYRTGWINYLPDKDSKEYYNQTFKSE